MKKAIVKRKEEVSGSFMDLDPVWKSLNAEEQEEIRQNLELVQYNKNQVIYSEGEESRFLCMLLKGKVRIYKEGIGQRQQIIRLLKPHDLFGYRSVIANEPHNTNASAFEACSVYRLSREVFSKLIQSNGSFCYQIMHRMAKDLATSELQTVNLTQKHIRGRLAESLLQLVKSYGYEEDSRTLAMLLPREDLANMSNMTTSNAIRTLSQFAQEGLLVIEGRRIQILNEKELEHISRLG